MFDSHGSGQGDPAEVSAAGRPCPGGSECTAGPFLEVAWVDGSSSLGHRVYAAAGRNVIGHGWVHSEPATCPHGGEPTGIWVQLDEQHHPVSPEPPEAGDYLVCRGCGMDFT